ncbi:PREDICTED: uncharacterized protein LOC108975789 [Bactrocera latifrons]|uniref:uncharacterized protein LOC108975789 n=1 Tax=Bactrocera latifrons TaxID=174628 RepID=UPI0008DE77F7|nr:PREDICTED: uncharacterized protein LOC108975789 [Bactrocera latifrons]
MKFFNITLLLVVLALVCCFSLTYAQEEGAAPSGPKRPALRRPVGGKAAKTTTTTASPEEEDNEYEEGEGNAAEGEDGDEEGLGASSTTTTTEAPKKVIGPVIRPFRSNDDFLNSLKRRQQDAKKHRFVEKPTPKSKPAPSHDEDADEGAESAPAPSSKGFKGGNSALNRRKLSKPGKPEPAPADDAASEESEQEPKEQARRLPHARLALRKRN